MTHGNEGGPRPLPSATPKADAQVNRIPPPLPKQAPRRPDSPAWIDAKRTGDAGETALAEYFAGRGFTVVRTHGPADFDIRLEKTVEVKHDRRAAETGNIAFEVAYKGAPSGILISRVALWAIRVGNEYLIAETRVYRELVQRKPWPSRPAGDGGHAVVRLIPVETVRALRGVTSVTLDGAP